jgi:hypothetical protein
MGGRAESLFRVNKPLGFPQLWPALAVFQPRPLPCPVENCEPAEVFHKLISLIKFFFKNLLLSPSIRTVDKFITLKGYPQRG